MARCEISVESPLDAKTFTGPTETQVNCDIGSRVDIKHFVSFRNMRNFPIDVTSFATIRSEPRLIHFELGEQNSDEGAIALSEQKWTAVCAALDTNERKTFGVSLLSNRPDSSEQQIEVKLTVNRWHEEGHSYEMEFPLITVSS